MSCWVLGINVVLLGGWFLLFMVGVFFSVYLFSFFELVFDFCGKG